MAGASEPLDPYTCLNVPKRKYAGECTEVYLTHKGAETLSDKFSHFTNLEVMWLTGNRLSHLNDLDLNIRVREVYVQDNRLVSLQGLRTFKFLKVLSASNNQLRNLDKQLAVLSKFSFLRKLDLFDNPAAEEPDYRLRAIYALPQVEVLDKLAVKGLERIRAEEVVPNMDKVVYAEKVVKKAPPKHSKLELGALREASAIRERRRADRERAMLATFTLSSSAIDPAQPPPEARAVGEHRRLWGNPAQAVARELVRPSPWEQVEMRPLIVQRAGKDMLTRQEAADLARDLARDGLDEVGRVLGDVGPLGLDSMEGTLPAAPSTLAGSGRTQLLAASAPASALAAASLDALFAKEAAVAVSDVANWLLKLDWPRPDDDNLDRRIRRLYDEAEADGDSEARTAKRMTALRLEGAKTRKFPVAGLGAAVVEPLPEKIRRRPRGDLFNTTLNRPSREVDEATGQVRVKVKQESRAYPIGCY